MTDTYTGWDGKDYPWPPPDGWYEASDGRWWAPGTGPNPPPDTPAPPSRPRSFSPGDLGDGYDDPSGPDPRTAQLASAASRRPAYDEPDTALSGGPSHTPPGGVDYGATSTFAAGDLPGPGGPATTRTPAIDGSLPPPGSGHRPDLGAAPPGGGRKFLFLALGVVLALVVLGGAYVFLSGGDDEAASGGASTTATSADGASPESTAPTSGSDSTVAGQTTSTDGDGSASTTETTDTDGSTDSTDGSGASTTVAVDPTEIDQFRSILRDNGLTSDKLTDADVLGFGNSFCDVAASSDSPEVFDGFRQDAIESTANTTLEPEELGMVIDTAIVAFCPEEAERLGIEV